MVNDIAIHSHGCRFSIHKKDPVVILILCIAINARDKATHSGKPNVLGWVGHESQWRGGSEAMGSRAADLERLYCSRDWQEARDIIETYNIRYVVVGPLERSAYQNPCPVGVVESKFPRFMQVAFQNGSVTIYEYTGGE